MSLHRKALKSLLAFASPRARQARMRRFAQLLDLQPGGRIIDLGGQASQWRFLDIPMQITILNLPDVLVDQRAHGPHTFTFVAADATDAPQIADMSYDIAFSNSCIEHVGPAAKRQAFAETVRRVAPDYYVQTPAPSFLIEAHTGLPFWWSYPEKLRIRLIKKWSAQDPEYAEFIAGTVAVDRKELHALFPDAQIERERILGLTKSIAAWRISAARGQRPVED